MISRALNALGSAFRYRSLADELTIEQLTAARDNANAIRAEVEKSRDDWKAKFKLAATDLAKQAEELNDAKLHIDHLGITFNQRLADAIQDYQADALLWRAAREKRAARKGSVS